MAEPCEVNSVWIPQLSYFRNRTHPVQRIDNVPQRSLNTISALIPFPITEDIVVHVPLVYENVLFELGGVIVEKVSKGVDYLGDCRGKEMLLLGQIFRQRDERVECSCLVPREVQEVYWSVMSLTLNDGIGISAMFGGREERFCWENFVDNSWMRPSVSGTATSQVLWSEGIASKGKIVTWRYIPLFGSNRSAPYSRLSLTPPLNDPNAYQQARLLFYPTTNHHVDRHVGSPPCHPRMAPPSYDGTQTRHQVDRPRRNMGHARLAPRPIRGARKQAHPRGKIPWSRRGRQPERAGTEAHDAI
jgi:hypothetical protein